MQLNQAHWHPIPALRKWWWLSSANTGIRLTVSGVRVCPRKLAQNLFGSAASVLQCLQLLAGYSPPPPVPSPCTPTPAAIYRSRVTGGTWQRLAPVEAVSLPTSMASAAASLLPHSAGTGQRQPTQGSMQSKPTLRLLLMTGAWLLLE